MSSPTPPGDAAPSPRSTGPVPPLLLLAGMGSRQSGAALATPLFATLGPIGVTGLRLVFSSIILLAVNRPALPRGRRTLGMIAAYGTLLAGMNFAFYQALDRIPLGVTVAVEFLGPLVVALIGSRRTRDVAWAALAAAGVGLLSWNGGAESWVGIGFALLAAGCWAGYILLGAALSRRTGDNSGLSWAMACAATISLPLILTTTDLAALTPGLLLAGAALAVLSSVIPYSLEFRVLRRLPPRTFGILMSLEPAIGAAIGYLLLSQQLTGPELLAVAAVVTASIGATRPTPPRADTGHEPGEPHDHPHPPRPHAPPA